MSKIDFFAEPNEAPMGDINFFEPADAEKEGEGVVKAFAKGAQKGATAGYFGEFEPVNTSEKIANAAGELVGFAGPAIALGPVGKLGTSALSLGASVAARAAIEGAVYGAVRKPEEGESRFGNAGKDAMFFGAGGLAGEIGGKILASATPYTEKVMQMAKEFSLAPEQAEQIVKRVHAGEQFGKVYDEISNVARELPGGGVMELNKTPPTKPYGAGREAIGAEVGRALEQDISPYIKPGIIDPGLRISIPDERILAAGMPDEIPEFNFPSSKRPEYGTNTPKHNSLVKSGYLTEESELTPLGAQNAKLFEWIRPKSMEEKGMAMVEKVPSSLDKDFEMLSPGVKNFVRNEVEGSLVAVSDSFASGKTLAEALDKGVQTFARPRKLELSPMDLRGAFEAVMAKSKLAMSRAREILPRLDPDMPSSSLATNAQISAIEAEAIIDDLGTMARGPLRDTAITPPVYQTTRSPVNALGEDIVTPEILDRALAVSDVTPEQFKNTGFLRSDGTLSEQGRSLLNMLNPEWKIPLTEKVLDKPPIPGRVGRNGRKYEAFDVNSPEGRMGLASVRAGGRSNYPLSRGTVEGFLPMSAEDAIKRRSPLIRKVGDGYQFTEKGAALAATRPGGIVKEIDLAANRQYLSNTPLGGGSVSFEGGRGGKSFTGLSEAEVKRANLDYEVAKATVLEHREAALQWKGCPPGEGE